MKQKSAFLTANKFIDMIVLNVAFVISCLPLFTIGAAVSALYSVMFKLESGDEGYVLKSYINAFKKNFKKATIVWGLTAPIIAVFVIVFSIYLMNIKFVPIFVSITLFISLLIFLVYLVTVFPYIARFDDTLKQTLVNSLLLGIMNFPKSVLVIFLFGQFIFLLFYNQVLSMIALGFILIIGFSATFLIASQQFQKIF